MQDVSKGQGRTVLFVSHNMTAVRNLCQNGIIIKNGCISEYGDIDTIINSYLMVGRRSIGYNLSNFMDFEGSGKLRIGNVKIHSLGETNGIIINNKPVSIVIEIINTRKQTGILEIALIFKNNEHIYVNYSGNRLTRQQFSIPEDNSFYIEACFPEIPLSKGSYTIGIELMIDKELVWWADEIVKFNVEEIDYYGSGDSWSKGVFLLKQDWHLL